jgi:hypothetical protein
MCSVTGGDGERPFSGSFDSTFDSGLLNQENCINYALVGSEVFVATLTLSRIHVSYREVTLGKPLFAAYYMLEFCLASIQP